MDQKTGQRADTPQAAAKTAGTFRYEGAVYFALAMFMITFALEILYWGAELTRTEPATVKDWLIYALAIAQLGVTLILPFARADIVVDETGIYRRFLGLWPYKKIRWDNIRKITTRPVPYPPARGQENVRGITLHPIKARGLLPGGKFGFSDSVSNWQDLLAIINHHIAAHGIEVQAYAKKKGWQPATHI